MQDVVASAHLHATLDRKSSPCSGNKETPLGLLGSRGILEENVPNHMCFSVVNEKTTISRERGEGDPHDLRSLRTKVERAHLGKIRATHIQFLPIYDSGVRPQTVLV